MLISGILADLAVAERTSELVLCLTKPSLVLVSINICENLKKRGEWRHFLSSNFVATSEKRLCS